MCLAPLPTAAAALPGTGTDRLRSGGVLGASSTGGGLGRVCCPGLICSRGRSVAALRERHRTVVQDGCERGVLVPLWRMLRSCLSLAPAAQHTLL